jgi:hypothetical protein
MNGWRGSAAVIHHHKINEKEEGILQIIVPDGCGNAPRKIILRDLFIAIVEKDIEVISDYVDESLIYTEVGNRESRGIQSLFDQLEETVDSEVRQLEFYHIITHGKTAAVNGKVVTADRKELHFSTVVVFSSAGKQAKVKKMKSYIIFV